MLRIRLALLVGVLLVACAPSGDTSEIVDNLVQVGFSVGDIQVIDGRVYVGRDAEVSLAAAREMLASSTTGEEQYHTTNRVSGSVTRICVDGSMFTGVFSTALDLAIQNYNQRRLTFAMARTPRVDCSFTINGVIQPGLEGGFSGFPAGGLPFGTITIGGGLSTFALGTVTHVITHELGHTIGLRHSDFFNRSISCGGVAVNEENPPSGVGAILVSGSPSGATVGGSLMNSCFRPVEPGVFTATDVTALRVLYPPSGPFCVEGASICLGQLAGQRCPGHPESFCFLVDPTPDGNAVCSCSRFQQ